MYKLLPLVFLIACGGEFEQSCEDQGMTTKSYFVEDMDTGEQFIYEQCEEECQTILCKQGDCPVCLKK